MLVKEEPFIYMQKIWDMKRERKDSVREKERATERVCVCV